MTRSVSDITSPAHPSLARPASPYRVTGPDDHPACFSAVGLETGELAGEALLWDIDLHNRTAHVGISLLPAFRGRRLGTDAVRVLCRYGFAIRGLLATEWQAISQPAGGSRRPAAEGGRT